MKRICTMLAFAFFVAAFAGCGDSGSSKPTTGEVAPGKTGAGPGAPPPPPPPPLPGKG